MRKMPQPEKHFTIVIFTVFTILCTASSAVFAADPRLNGHASFSAGTTDKVGQEVILEIALDIPGGFILYSPTVVPDGPIALQISPDEKFLKPVSAWFGPPPHVKWDDAFETKVEYYESSATFRRVFNVVQRPDNSVTVMVTGQICDDRSCYNQSLQISAPPESASNAPTRVTNHKLSGIAFDETHEIGPVTTTKAVAESTGETSLANPEALGLGAFLIMAIVAGFGALLTPCVFPMIPITISFFSKNEGMKRRDSLLLAGVYAGAIIVVYTIPGVLLSMIFGAGSMQQISTHPIFNIFITLLLIFFGLNLLGLFELRLPGWLINKSAQKEQTLERNSQNLKSKIGGVFFMAVTFTLVSFSCTVGFVGGWVLPLAARGQAFYPLVGMLAFSNAFALPFFFLAVFPGIADRLQGKSGDWMVAVKVVFGVVELAAALKFISNLDLNFELGVITRNVTLWLWVAIFLVGALLILKVFSGKGDGGSKKPGVTRIILAVILIGFAAKSYTGIGNSRPLGGWIDGWLPPVPYPSEIGKQSDDGLHLPFLADNLNLARRQAISENRPLFVDFTGFQCANCRQMESNYFPKPDIRNRLKEMVRVKLYTDGPKPIHTQQREYQFKRFQTAVLPFYVILDPKTDSVLATFSSLARDKAEYVAFLDDGLRKFREHHIGASAASVGKNRISEKDHTAPAAPSQEKQPPSTGPAFEFELPLLVGDGVRSSDVFTGHWTLVNFWASYCAPCKKELAAEFPTALKLHPKIQLVTIALEPEETIPTARTFIQSTPLADHIHLRAAEDWPEETLPPEMMAHLGMPSTFLLSPEGALLWAHKGAVDARQLDEVIKKFVPQNDSE
jgi:thiol:disulfide interchange protein/thiol-disulfide isomerase/thioredoxin